MGDQLLDDLEATAQGIGDLIAHPETARLLAGQDLSVADGDQLLLLARRIEDLLDVIGPEAE